MSKKIAVFIPARMQSTRLPGKPLADIHGKPMIVHVLERSLQAKNISDVYVACAEAEIAAVVEKCGGKAILTNPDHPSGTDRIYEALQKSGGDYDYIVNVQGDLPSLDHKIIDVAVALMDNPAVDIATLAAVIKHEHEKTNPNVVKAVIAFENDKSGRALYFTRATAPHGEGELYHHIGLYVYRRESLEKFVNLAPSLLEKREKLEQLRALENNMRIDAAIVDAVPLGVDTPEDLEAVRSLLSN